MPIVSMECIGCNREFEIVEISFSFVDEDMTETMKCPTCGMEMAGRAGKVYISDPMAADLRHLSRQHPDGKWQSKK